MSQTLDFGQQFIATFHLRAGLDVNMTTSNCQFTSHTLSPQPWIVVTYHPGFTRDLISWNTEIGHDGFLFQIVSRPMLADPAKQEECYGVQLAFEQMYELQTLIETTDFDAPTLADRTFCIDDVAQFALTVHDGSKTLSFVTRFMRPIWVQPRYDYSSAWTLWTAIDDLSPYGLHSDEPEQSNT